MATLQQSALAAPSATSLRPIQRAERSSIAIPSPSSNRKAFCQKPNRDRGRVAIFIDASNLFYAASSMEIQIEYSRLLSYVAADSIVGGAFFYTGIDPLKEREKRFLSQLQREGYQVIEKELVRRSDGSKKANLDVEIALDMVLKGVENLYNTAVLISGDGDFTYAVNAVKSQGKRVEVIGLYHMTSHTLIQAADQYTNLGMIKNQIRKSQPSGKVYRLPDHFPKKKSS
jgi:uncharacterized LabA/DUF88 family protein